MSLVHYKFKSGLKYGNVTFDGQHISVGDLKKEIVAQQRFRPGACELQFTDTQTGAAYNNWDLVARNQTVTVMRVPAAPRATCSRQKAWEAFKKEAANSTPDLANANMPEIDKLTAALEQSKMAFYRPNYMGKHHYGPVWRSYSCRRCHQPGHHIRNCPRQRDNYRPYIKRASGIPNSFLTYVDDPQTPGALLTPSGRFAVPTLDAQAFKEGKKEHPPFLPQPKRMEPEKPQTPSELKCPVCKELMTDAAIISCCGYSHCDQCIRDALLETEDHQCPTCGQYGVSPNGIIPNISLRIAVTAFTKGGGYSQIRRRSTEGLLTQNAPQSSGHQLQPEAPPVCLSSTLASTASKTGSVLNRAETHMAKKPVELAAVMEEAKFELNYEKYVLRSR